MSDILIRGLSARTHQTIQRLARLQNLSVNQALLQLIATALEKAEEEKKENRRREGAFQRALELREEIYRKYGEFDDSTKLIREDRDSR